MLLLLLPLLLVIAVAIKLDSRGSVVYRQPRRGRNGSEFTIAKFRTMHVGAEARRSDVLHLNEVDGPLFKAKKGDPRVTRIGGFLRRYSLDELPQLLNVIRGDMSLVGPRPFVVYEADQITGWAARRLDMTPGITGLWQVLGRNDIPFDEMVKLDYLYVTNWSLWWDMKILCQTDPGRARQARRVLVASLAYAGEHVEALTKGAPAAPIGSCPHVFIVPAYNEAENLPRLLADLETRQSLFPEGCSVIVVDDGSADGTAELAESYDGSLDVEVVRMGTNQGPGAAFRAGFAAALARFDDDEEALVITLEADTTSNLDSLPLMLSQARTGAHVVARRRGGWSTSSAKRRLLSRGAGFVIRRMLGVNAHTVSSFYRVYRASRSPVGDRALRRQADPRVRLRLQGRDPREARGDAHDGRRSRCRARHDPADRREQDADR